MWPPSRRCSPSPEADPVDTQVRALMAVARAKAAAASGEPLQALTEWFASQPAISATELPDELVDELVAHGFSRQAVIDAGKMASHPPLTGRSRYGSPSPKDGMTAVRRIASEEPGMRAQFVLAGAQRLTDADDFAEQLAAEQRYRDMHAALGRKRRRAARQVDDAESQSHSGWLVWRCAAKPEARCAALEGRLFTPDNPPGVYPGAVHVSCRCHAEPWNGPTPGA